MTRTLLTVVGVVMAASSGFAAEVKVIDRKPVAHGAEVVLEPVKGDEGKAGQDVTDDFHHVEAPRVVAIHQDALSTTANRIDEWVPFFLFDPAELPERMAIRERLKKLHGSFLRSKAPTALPPLMAGGRELALFSMIDMIRLIHKHKYGGFISLSRSVSGSPGPDATTEYVLNRCRATPADLPCFATDYDKAVAEVSAIYDRWKEHSATRLAKSLHGIDDVGFLTVIEWEMARAEK